MPLTLSVDTNTFFRSADVRRWLGEWVADSISMVTLSILMQLSAGLCWPSEALATNTVYSLGWETKTCLRPNQFHNKEISVKLECMVANKRIYNSVQISSSLIDTLVIVRIFFNIPENNFYISFPLLKEVLILCNDCQEGILGSTSRLKW